MSGIRCSILAFAFSLVSMAVFSQPAAAHPTLNYHFDYESTVPGICDGDVCATQFSFGFDIPSNTPLLYNNYGGFYLDVNDGVNVSGSFFGAYSGATTVIFNRSDGTGKIFDGGFNIRRDTFLGTEFLGAYGSQIFTEFDSIGQPPVAYFKPGVYAETSVLVFYTLADAFNQAPVRNGFDTPGTLTISYDKSGPAPVIPLQPPSAVPEPATWAMMLLGLGIVGLALRRRVAVPVRLAA